MNKAAFLDRDGVLLEDLGVVTNCDQLHLAPDVSSALAELKEAGYLLILITNQAVVARGLISERELAELHEEMQNRLVRLGAPRLDDCYACPHHPHANEPTYRIECDCRKPKPGMLLQAAEKWNVDVAASFMIGDRLSDIAAGAAAGCQTVLINGFQTESAPIVGFTPDASIQPDYTCADLSEAANWILNPQQKAREK